MCDVKMPTPAGYKDYGLAWYILLIQYLVFALMSGPFERWGCHMKFRVCPGAL